MRELENTCVDSDDVRDEARIVKAWGRKKAKHKNEFLYARDGDHLLTPFECDLCIFRKLRKDNPNPKSQADILLMATIRRANLDAFWSRAADTVNAHRLRLLKGMRLSE